MTALPFWSAVVVELLSDEAVSVPDEEASDVPELLEPVPVAFEVTVPVPVVVADPELDAVASDAVEEADDVAVCVAVAEDAV